MGLSSLSFLTWLVLASFLASTVPLEHGESSSVQANTTLPSTSDVLKKVPFLISIQKRNVYWDLNDPDQGGDHLCGGALLDAYSVLTTADCALQHPTFDYQIVAGTNVLSGTFARQRRLVSRIIIHPYYDRNKHGRVLYNMAILVVKEPFDFNDHVYAKLPNSDDIPKEEAQLVIWDGDAIRYTKERVKIREPVTVTSFLVIICFALSSYLFGFSGLGYICAALLVWTTYITVRAVLSEEEIDVLHYRERYPKMETYKIISQGECENRFNNLNKENVDWANNILCTTTRPGKSVDDSGGLLVQDGVLVGILCRISESRPIFLRVSAFRNWIKRSVG